MKQIILKIDEDVYPYLKKKIREKTFHEGIFEDNVNKFLNQIIIALDKDAKEILVTKKDGKLVCEKVY